MLAQTIKSENMKYDVAIIGGGPAGYTAAEKGTGSAGYGIIPAFIADSVCI